MKGNAHEQDEAKELAQTLQVPYISREKRTLVKLFTSMNHSAAIVVTHVAWRYERADGYRFQFHPNMSALRVKQLKQGGIDPLLRASGMSVGETVLDCTLGMGADAIVASFLVGEQGQVIGLESQAVIAHIVRHGLAHFVTNDQALTEAMRRVQVIESDYRSYLAACPTASVDYVMFDPMFRETIHSSKPMQQLKPLANPNPLDLNAVEQALRVARKAVLFKERLASNELQRLGFAKIYPSSQYAWGVIRKDSLE